MSLPPELRILCYQLSSTPPVELPRLTPVLLRLVSRCEGPLSSPTSNAVKADSSASVVLVHKLKTQLTTLLNGKIPEGRFTAAVLIKGVVEVGGWEVLRGAEAWARGLLALLGKSDPAASKELCIIALTKIYCMTHQYPTLVREITTPTLPAFITSCLNLISNPSSKVSSVPSSLTETVFGSFSTLLPRHTTIFRPFAAQIRLIAKPYLAPTLSDKLFVPASLRESSRSLVIALHQTVAKNAGGEEWGKAVREIVKDIHRTSDYVFRAVVEDWESTSGYIAEPVNISDQLCGGAKRDDDLSRWDGVSAGVERLTGLLEILAQYFKNEVSTPVSIPLGPILDVITRMMSIAIPSESASAHGGARLHPAIDRDERDGLWCGLPQIHVATLQLVSVLADRMQEIFLPMAPGLFDQIVWAFSSGRGAPEFRLVTYNVVSKILLQIGQSFGRNQAAKLAPIIRSCCGDLRTDDAGSGAVEGAENSGRKTQHSNGINANQNADTFLQTNQIAHAMDPRNADLELAASNLLHLLLSYIPQHHLDIALRSLIERTAILTHDKNAMLASVLNPFVGKNGKAMASILPHITRQFGNDNVVEILLRPRMPLLPTSAGSIPSNDALDYESEEDNVIGVDMEAEPQPKQAPDLNTMAQDHTPSQPGLGPVAEHASGSSMVPNPFAPDPSANAQIKSPFGITPTSSTSHAIPTTAQKEDVNMESEDEDSDDESVHLNMELDSDSDDDKSE